MRDTWQVCRRHLRMRSSQAKNKETVATQIAQTRKSTLPSPTGMQSRQTGANTDQGPLAEIRTRSGRLVKQPKYLKDYEL